MKVYLEILFSKLSDEEVICSREFLDISEEKTNPDQLIQQLLEEKVSNLAEITRKQDLLVHSTSWRYQSPDHIILTYLVYSESLKFFSKDTRHFPIKSLNIAANPDAKSPRPKVIRYLHIVSHGFRHLSFLAKTNPHIRKTLARNPRTLKAFDRIATALAGSLVGGRNEG